MSIVGVASSEVVSRRHLVVSRSSAARLDRVVCERSRNGVETSRNHEFVIRFHESLRTRDGLRTGRSVDGAWGARDFGGITSKPRALGVVVGRSGSRATTQAGGGVNYGVILVVGVDLLRVGRNPCDRLQRVGVEEVGEGGEVEGSVWRVCGVYRVVSLRYTWWYAWFGRGVRRSR